MPISDCSSIVLGEGDTLFGVENMRDWTLKYAHHTQKLAPQLKGRSLKETCINIHNFLYKHFQYKIDGSLQQLRSPACSWATREIGIDCKSYSIFGSTILYNLGINHYFRRIKQAPNTGFTHVYLVVPINQNTNNLDRYFVIDGTIKLPEEVEFYLSDDLFIGTKKYGLNAPAVEVQDPLNQFTDQSLTLAENNVEAQKQAIKNGYVAITGTITTVVGGALALTGVGTVITVIIGIVGSLVSLAIQLFYDPCTDAFYEPKEINNRLKIDFLNSFKRSLNEVQKSVNIGVVTGSIPAMNTLLKEIDLGVAHYNHEKETHDGNACSQQALQSYGQFVQGIKDAVDVLYNSFITLISNDFDVQELQQEASTGSRIWYFIVPVTENPIMAKYRRLKVSVKRDNPHIIYPYNYDNGYIHWLNSNKEYLIPKIGLTRANEYYNAFLPYGKRIKEIRSNIYLPALFRHDQESDLRKEMRQEYYKYDTQYLEELKKKADKVVEMTIEARRNLLTELEDIKRNKIAIEIQRQRDLKAIKNAENKKTFLSLGFLGLMSLIYIKKMK